MKNENLRTISLSINGMPIKMDVKVDERLLDVIRDRLGLTGTKEACSVGDCGSCTVIMNGKAVNSCLVPAVRADGAQITTVEGLNKDMEGDLHPLQKSFLNHGAVQCGFCTPGMLLTAKAFLDENKNVEITRGMAKRSISGNLCRCTGYQKIIDAIVSHAQDNK